MGPSQLVVLALVSCAFSATSARSPGPPFEACLNGIRSGPDSFIPYFCLGTPGLPERPTEVMAVLQDVLGRKPREPHARVYLALMRMYRGEEIDPREFSEPLVIFEQKRFPPDLFLGQMAFIERS